MYEQDKIFGPLTFIQFIILAIGVGISYVVYNNLQIPLSYVVIIITLIACVGFMYRFKSPKISLDKLDEYFEQKRREQNPDVYKRFLMRKLAEVQAQVQIRKMKGLREDETLMKVLTALENAKHKVE